MNSRFSGTIKKLGYSVFSNLLGLIISFVIAMVVPKALDIEEYGYLQLYLFYSSYVGILQFGLTGGVYLRYGGKEYAEIDKPLLHSQYTLLTILEIIIFIIICVSSFFLTSDPNRTFIMIGVGVCCVLANPRELLMFLLQATGRIKEFARNTVTEKIIYASITVIMILFFGVRNFWYLILADLIAKAFAAFAGAYVCKDIVLAKGVELRDSLTEAWVNISVGIKMLFGSIAGVLILGIVRLVIERAWDVSVFGKVALALSVSNFMMVFISAVGIVMFPVLKRLNPENRGPTYIKLRVLLVIPILGAMIACQPAKWLLLLWLPKYADSALYLVLLFPICLFEGKVSALSNNYLNALRLEKITLRINIFSMSISAVVSIFCAYVIKSLPLCVFAILFLSAFRCVLSETAVSKKLGINISRDIVYELILVIIFVASGWFLQGWVSMLIYAASYLVYLFIQRDNIRDVIMLIKG